MALSDFIKPGYIILAVFVVSGIYVHLRGKVRYPILRQLTSHTNITAPYNVFVYLFSSVPNKPFISLEGFPELSLLKNNWKVIREEANELYQCGQIKVADKYNDAGFNSFFRKGWGRFYLKWYDEFLPSAVAQCPNTVELLKSIPSVYGALFASLPPGAKLGLHRDPYAGSLRYHLGLITPNSDACSITVDGQSYSWKDGEDVLFDETYAHTAENNSDYRRIILFCDVRRPLAIPWADKINDFVSRRLVKASETQNREGERVGLINKAFGYVYPFRLLAKRIKKWNREVYYGLKFLLFGGLIYLLVR